jgi:membrane protein
VTNPGTGAKTRTARARGTAARYATRLEETVLGRLRSRLLEVEFIDRSVALAAKAFVSFLPLLVIVSALSPDNIRQNVLTVITHRFGVSGDAFDTVRKAFTSPEQTKTAAGFVGILITVAFAVSFTTALQRVFLRAWRRPPGGGARNKARGVAWLGALLVLLLMVAGAGAILRGPAGSVLAWVVGLLGSTALWWWTARLMVRGEVRWRALLPTALVMGIGGWLYALSASLWMPTDVTSHTPSSGRSASPSLSSPSSPAEPCSCSWPPSWDPPWPTATPGWPAGCDPGTPPPSPPARSLRCPARPGRCGCPTPSAAATAVQVCR